MFQSPSLRGSGRFRPRRRHGERARRVSIPFIAGQWSLPSLPAPAVRRGGVSIPFIAGQWSLLRLRLTAETLDGAGFNPLHCGAVVASWRSAARPARRQRVSIPFIAGQWSLLAPRRVRRRLPGPVSIPFIAGQWSLHARRMAGVAGRRSFNPLHCGAVVASVVRRPPRPPRPPVSIPFIAGQWSLRLGQALMTTRKVGCFNPLHCGAVVASSN